MLRVTDAAGRDAGTELLTSNQAKKQYGPVDWSESVLERVHSVTENNDEEATPEVVKRWERNFERRAAEFGEGHKTLIQD